MQAAPNSMYPAPQQQWQNGTQFPYQQPAPYPTPTYSAHAALRNGNHQSYHAVMAQAGMAYPSPDRTNPYGAPDRSAAMSVQAPYGSALDSQGLPLPQSSPNVPLHPSAHPYGHSRSHSASHPYATPQSPNMAHQQDPYAAQVAYAEQMDAASSQYPASPQRPFSCDMCALSFNRQHDLKRHRDTHTGEKPFLCNGGCGKTFTRKDALKRHQVRPAALLIRGRISHSLQLVKRCGIDEGA